MKYTSRKQAPWASDDNASSLLDSILDDTRDAALAETRELAHAVEARRKAEVETRRAELEAQRAHTAERMEMESARQAQIQVRRTAALRAITAEDAPDAIAASTPAPVVERAQLPMIAAEPRLIEPVLIQHMPPHPERLISNTTLVALAAAGIVMVGAVTLLSTLLLPGYVPDPTPYPKVVMHPTTTRDLVTGEAFMLIPIEAPAAAIIAAPSSKKQVLIRRDARISSPEKKEVKRARPSLSELLNDDGDDIFGTMDKSGK